MKAIKISLVAFVSLFSLSLYGVPFDKTGLIDMQSSATTAGSCYAVSSAAQIIALGKANFNASDSYG